MSDIALPEKLIWHTWEYDFIPKSRNWYYVIGIVAGGLAVAATILANILFAILVAVAAFTIMLFGARPPKEVDCELFAQGLRLNGELYPFTSLDSFWVNTEVKQCLIFKSKKLLSPYLIVPAETLNPDLARAFIIKYLKEEEHRLPFSELLSRRLGF